MSEPARERNNPGITARPPGPSGPADQLSLLQFFNVLLKHRRATIGAPIIGVILAIVMALTTRPIYTAMVSFVPEGGGMPSLPGGLAGLAGQLGISLNDDRTFSPRFYADVVRSRGILEAVLMGRFANPQSDAPADSATLLDILGVPEGSQLSRLDRGVRRLGRMVSSRVDNQTNIIRAGVDSPHPELAAAIANRLMVELHRFNSGTRIAQAREQARFAASALEETERELRRAEAALKTFYERNRGWQRSPELAVEEERIRSEVDFRKDVYRSVTREYATARIQQANETPLVTVIDTAVAPLERSRPRRRLMVMTGLIFGIIAGVLWASVAEYLERQRRAGAEDYVEFNELIGRMRLKRGQRG